MGFPWCPPFRAGDWLRLRPYPVLCCCWPGLCLVELLRLVRVEAGQRQQVAR